MLEGVLVVRAGICGVLAKRCNGVGEVWLSRQHRIHEGTKHSLIRLGVDGGGRELEEMLVCQGGRGNGVGVLHAIALQGVIYELFL